MSDLSLQQLQQMVEQARRRIEQELFPAVREVCAGAVELPATPTRTAGACLEALELLATIHKHHTDFLETNHVMFGDDQRKRLEAAMKELGLEYPEAEA